MKLSDCSSPYENEEMGTKKYNKTLRKKITDQKQFEFLINRNEDEDSLANFNPIEPAKITKTKDNNEYNNDEYRPNFDMIQNNDFMAFTTQPTSAPPTSYPPPVIQQPYYQQPETPQNDRLNYIIRLLEEQRDEKTDTVTENLILYGFLGIFIIFVMDSFIKTGREYTR